MTNDTTAKKPTIQIAEITIPTKFNYQLAGTLFMPDLYKNDIKTAVMLAPATGIKRQFYKGFATYLAEHGFAVVTFDNDGIGGSLKLNENGNVKKSHASLIGWGWQDMPAVLDFLMAEFPNASYHLVGHSAGGQLIGLMPNHDKLTSVFNVACSSGRLKNMALPYQAKARFFLQAFIPANNLLFGYTHTDKVGMGEPLPKNVAKQWGEWCAGQGYIKTAFGKTVHQHFYDKVTTPSLWVNASDDDIANDKNVADMIGVFPNMPVEKHTLIPADYGLKEIGHMKFFSRQSQVLWSQAIDWIKKHS